MSTMLHVYLDGVLAGVASQKNGSASFVYDPDYLAGADPTPLSLSMPLNEQRYTHRVVNAWLEGLLPDSSETRERWGRQYSASPNNPFSLLRHVGRDAAGAVQILPPEIVPPDAALRTGDVDWLDDRQFDTMLRDLSEHGADWDPGAYGGRWSLAGAQAKIALHALDVTNSDGTVNRRWGVPRDSTPTTHIIKPSLDGFDDHHVNEAMCMLAASHVGLPAAMTELIDEGDLQAVVSHRYDRIQRDGTWHRLHQEDTCQALSVHPANKYQSDGGPGVGEIADLLLSLDDSADRQASTDRFVRYLAFNVLIGGTDAHAKNYSMLLRGSRAQMAPLYDVASAACYSTHERLKSPMRIGSARAFLDVTETDWRKVAKRLDLDGDEVLEIVEDMRTELPRAFEAATAELPESARDVARAQAERIVEHVNRGWKPDRDRAPGSVLTPSRFRGATPNAGTA